MVYADWAPLATPMGQRIALSDVASINVEDGPSGIKSENARINGWTFVDIEGIDVGGYVDSAQKIVRGTLGLPTGYSIAWAGQYEYMQKAKETMLYVIPLTLFIIIVLLYLNFRNFTQVSTLVGSLPVALVDSDWLMYVLDFNLSIYCCGSGIDCLSRCGGRSRRYYVDVLRSSLVCVVKAWFTRR